MKQERQSAHLLLRVSPELKTALQELADQLTEERGASQSATSVLIEFALKGSPELRRLRKEKLKKVKEDEQRRTRTTEDSMP